MNFETLREMPQDDTFGPTSINSSRANSTTTNSIVETEHTFPRRRSSSTSRLSSSSSSRNGHNIGNRGNGVNRGSIRKAKISSERFSDSVSAAKQGFSITPDSMERTMQEQRHPTPNYPEFHHIPVEIHAKILRLLDPLDVLAYSRTCKRFEKYGDGQKVW